MKGKKLFPLLLAAVLSMSLFLFTACSGKDNGGGKNPPTHVHSVKHTAAVAPTCTTAGNVDYWYCSGCGKYFSDEDCTEEIKGSITLPAGHKFSSTYQTSETEHWKKCENCEVVEQRAAHDFGGDRECDICGYKLSYTPGLYYENIDSETCKVVIGDACAAAEIIIPATHDGRAVVEIAVAFVYRSNLTSITIPASVTAIGNYAFEGCTNLQTVTFDGDSKLETIGMQAFYDCGKLKSITIPASVTSIGRQAFSGCTGLQTVTFVDESELESISEGAFRNCSSLTEITIPASVTHIGSEAFSDCSSLTSISLPFVGDTPHNPDDIWQYPFGYIFGRKSGIDKSIMSQGYITDFGYTTSALWYKPPALKTVTITGSSYIPYCAFQNCDNLTSITIPASVTSIGTCAFDECSSLTSITIPASVTAIGNSAFSGCSNLTSITIPASVTSIGDWAFYGCSSLTSITIPASVTSIGDCAFQNCDNLTSITIPEKVTSIGRGAFLGCERLTYATYQNARYLGNHDNPYAVLLKADNTDITLCSINEKTRVICSEAFYNCSKLASITIPASVTAIGDSAFSGCTKLQTVNWNATNCTKAGSYESSSKDYTIFKGCTSLATVNIGADVENIPDYAFFNMYSSLTNLMKVTFAGDSKLKTIGESAFENRNLTSITIPASVTSIGSGAFADCSKLTSITIPASVTYIGERAFRNCSRLQPSATKNNLEYLGNSKNPYLYLMHATNRYITDCMIDENTKFIGDSAFSGCSGLTEITIPESVTSIGDSAFSWCSGLTEITIPESVTSIGRQAFLGCTGLQTVNWNATNCTEAGRIGSSVIFYNCTSLTTVNIGENVQTIPEYAFYGCSKLTEITIPASVTSIDDNAFAYCDNLQTVNWDATNCTKAGSLSDPIFYGCTSLTTVNIGENVEIIPDYAFYGCSNITEITIPANVTSIGYWAFRECTNLQTVTFDGDSKLETIGTQAFYDCVALKSITIPASVTSIGYEAFYRCNSLTATFENPNGWKTSPAKNGRGLFDVSKSDLQDQSTAAGYLTKTFSTDHYGYSDYYWQRS